MAARTSSSSVAPVGVDGRTVAGVAAAVVGVAAAAVLTTKYIKRRKARAVTVVPSTPADLERHFDALSAAFIASTVARFKLPAFIPARLKRVLEYNCKGGKYFRGLLVLDTVRTLAKERGLDYASLETRAVALGWAIEVMQAYFLVSDDIMDGSTTRRGKPCWYLVEDVKLDAVNDALVLASFMQWLIRTHITDPTEQLAFSMLFEDVSYQTELGQMLDLCNQPQGQVDTKLLDGFSEEAYQAYIAIIMNKTAIYTFFLPIACGMRLCGYTSERQMASARNISTEIGIKFQIQDDYLDAFGVDIGKDGTDIQDHKATWLLMMALKRIAALNAADQERQRAILKANYGKKEHKDQKESKQQSVEAVARVKALYLELGIEDEYKLQEQTSFDKIRALIEAEKCVLPPDVYLPILNKVHGRKK